MTREEYIKARKTNDYWAILQDFAKRLAIQRKMEAIIRCINNSTAFQGVLSLFIEFLVNEEMKKYPSAVDKNSVGNAIFDNLASYAIEQLDEIYKVTLLTKVEKRLKGEDIVTILDVY